jgi:hypothetical protein
LTQDHPAALAAEKNHSTARYAVTVEVTVEAWSENEAAQVVRGFLGGVFTGSEYKLGNVHAANTEPPSDETWLHALACALA